MCKFLSGVLTKDKCFFSLNTDSHEEIIKEFNLYHTGVRGCNVVRIELTPPEKDRAFDFRAKPSKWIYRVDEDLNWDKPEWYDAKNGEDMARGEAASILKQILFIDKKNVGEIKQGRIYLISSSAVLRGSSRAELWGSSRAELRGSSSAVLRGSSSAVLRGSSTIFDYRGNAITIYNANPEIKLVSQSGKI
jgi:hypothetical protein